MISKGYIKRVGSSTVDVLLIGSAATLTNVPLSGQINAGALTVGMTVLVDTIDGRPVVLHTITDAQRAPTGGSGGYNVVTNNALLADGSVPLTGDLAVAPGVTIDGYDISTLGQAIDNLQAADTIARTGYTVLSHASHLVETIGPDDSELLIRHGIFADQEMLSLSNTEGQIEVMQVVGDPVATVDNRGALCYRYTVTRRVNTNPGYLTIGWAAATLVNGLTHKGYIAFDGRHTSPGAPSMRFGLITDVAAGSVEQIVRVGSLYNSLGLGADDYGFAAGRLTTGDRYFAYNYNRNLLALRGADMEVSDPSGIPCFRVWGVAENGYEPGNTRLGKASGGHLETIEDRVDFYAGSQRVMTISPTGTRFRGMIWSGDQPGPQVGIGEDDGQGLIAARNAAGVGQFVVRTGDENVHVHVGNPVEIGGYAQFADGNFTTDGIIRARAFELLGGGTIGSGVVLTNAGKFTAGEGNNVAVIDGEDAAWRIYAGHATPASAPFRVNQAGEAWLTNAHVTGEVTASTGSIGGWTLNSAYLAKDTGAGNTSAGLAPNDYPFYAGSTYANRATAPFRVTPAGAMTATAGNIAGWTITSGHLYAGSGVSRTGLQPATYPFYAGNETPSAAPFRVTQSGSLTASNATITGTIYANAGHIDGSLYVGSTAPRLHLDGVNKRIESTNFASGTSGFRIEGMDGSAEFNNVTVRGALTASIIQYGYVQATNGSVWVTKAAGRSLAEFVAPKEAIAYLDIEDPDGMTHTAAGGLWLVDDVIRLTEPLAGDFWGVVTAKADMTTFWRLTVEDRSSAGVGTFPAGAAVLNYGQSGDGVVRITADASNSPYLSIATHTGSPWTTLTERARLGNLAGISGASGYGLWTDNGYFTGTINANAGNIGGWTINSGHLSGTNVGLAPADYPFYAGSTYANRATAPFRVTPAGAFYANSGNIAGWTLASTKLYSEDVAAYSGVGMATYQDADQWAFWAGSNVPGNAEFRVNKWGGLYATSATITGAVTASSGAITGTLTMGASGSISDGTRYKLDVNGLTLASTYEDALRVKDSLTGTVRTTFGYYGGVSLVQAKSSTLVLYAPNSGYGITLDAGTDTIHLISKTSHTGNYLGFFGATPVARPAAYTFTNGTTDRAINCDSTTVAELADVVYTMWNDLKSLGLLQ